MFKQLNIRQRLALMYAGLIFLLVLLGGLSIWAVNKQFTAFEQVRHRIFETAGHANGVRIELLQMRRFEKDMALGVEDAAMRADYFKRWNAASDKLDMHLEEVAKRVQEPRSIELMKAAKEGVLEYRTAIRVAVPKLEGLSISDANTQLRLGKGGYDKADASTVKALEQVDKFTTAAANKLKDLHTLVVRGSIGLLVFSLLFVVLVGRKVSASIVKPLQEAEEFAAGVRGGDLTQSLAVTGNDECGRLAQSLADMQTSLQDIVGKVRQAAESIQVASSEVASGNQDLSDRTEQTASSLQQTASSMNELTGTVNQTADSARTASQLASQASSSAERGGSVVGEVVTTMERINSSSRRIADIISTIDGIAFQTNILALNAAVEAARAGEAGRGFAVVAGEVRLLAQRSAEAAKEIKSLINASVESVGAGTRLVADAGNTMAEIVANVQRVTDIIGEISAAAGEQSSGIGNVNRSVANLDQATQQNAALVEQSAAAAQSLRDQAQRLSEVVATFKLPGASLKPQAAKPSPKQSPAPSLPATPVPTAPPPSSAPKPMATKPALPKVSAATKAKPAPAPSTAPRPAPSPAPSPAPAGNDNDWETF